MPTLCISRVPPCNCTSARSCAARTFAPLQRNAAAQSVLRHALCLYSARDAACICICIVSNTIRYTSLRYRIGCIVSVSASAVYYQASSLNTFSPCRGGPGLRNGPPRPVSRPNAPLAGGSQYLLPSSSRLGFCSAVRSGGGRRCWDVGALEGKSRKLSMTHPDRVPSLRVLVVGDAGAQRVGAETALPSFQG